MVGIAAEKILLEVVSDAVARPNLDTAVLARLAGAIPELDLRAAWRRSLAFEFKRPKMSVASGPGPEVRLTLPRTALYLAAPGYFDAPYVAWMARLMQAPDLPYGTRLVELTDQRPGGSTSPLAASTHQHKFLSQIDPYPCGKQSIGTSIS